MTEPADEVFADIRQDASTTPEMLDIAQAVERWDELMERCEAGESFVIKVNEQPKVRLVPMQAEPMPDTCDALPEG